MPRERDRVEVDHEPAAGAAGEVPGVDGEPVRDVEHRGRDAAEPEPLLDPDRRADVAPLAERRAGAPERAGDDDHVARTGAGPAGDARGAAERGDVDDDLRRRGSCRRRRTGTPASAMPS